jgi:hypothetical protein
MLRFLYLIGPKFFSIVSSIGTGSIIVVSRAGVWEVAPLSQVQHAGDETRPRASGRERIPDRERAGNIIGSSL